MNLLTLLLDLDILYKGILKLKIFPNFPDDDQTNRTRTLDQIDEEEEEENIMHGNHGNHAEEENIMHGNHDNHSEENLQKQSMVRAREVLADKSTKGKQLPIDISLRTVYNWICIETCRK